MQYSRFSLARLLMAITLMVCSQGGMAADRPEATILILGDSLSAAHNINIDKSWPMLLQKKLAQLDPPLNLINASISGETSEGGRERLPTLLQQHRPNYLIIELGGNDGLRGFPFSKTRENLQFMVDKAMQQNIKVLMIGVRLPPNLGPVYNRRFQDTYEQLAKTNPIAYLPRFLQGIAASDPALMQADGIHPTEIAQPRLAQRVFDALTREFALN